MELVQNRNKIEEYRKRAEDLVAQMTLSEKVAQTMHQTPASAAWRGACRYSDNLPTGDRNGGYF